jgi:hypothetical protein
MLMLKFGRMALIEDLTGTTGQSTPPRLHGPVAAPADLLPGRADPSSAIDPGSPVLGLAAVGGAAVTALLAAAGSPRRRRRGRRRRRASETVAAARLAQAAAIGPDEVPA